jgi:hypothetical protein
VADGDLPWSEKLLGWAVVICILIPLASLFLTKNAASIELFFHYLFLTILLLAALGLGWFVLWSMHKRSTEAGPRPLDDYGRPIKTTVGHYQAMRILPYEERLKQHRRWTIPYVFVSLGLGCLLWVLVFNEREVSPAYTITGFVCLVVFPIVSAIVGFQVAYRTGWGNLFPPEEEEDRNNPPIKVVLDIPATEPEPEPAPPPPEPIDARSRLFHALRDACVAGEYAIPPPHLFDIILSVGEQIFTAPRKMPYGLDKPRPLFAGKDQELWDATYRMSQHSEERILQAIVQSFTVYLSKLPRFTRAPFQRPFQPTANMLHDMIKPFRDLDHYDLHPELVRRFDINTAEYTDTVKGATKPLYPQRYKGLPEQMAETYLQHTPLLPLFDVLVPYQPFTDEMRFAHHWCLGKTGRGKTTFLRYLIKDDLDRVARSECSLVVVDSKKLIREMRMLRVFAEGQPLDRRLILIDTERPFPLNPFYLPEAQARTVLVYMLANMTEASGLQTGALTFLIDAAMKHDKPSLRTIRDFFKLDARKGELPAEWSRYDKDTKDWFQHNFKNLHAATREGLHQRLANFIKLYPNLNRMFEADSFGLDIEELHKGGKVLLVDTDIEANGEDGTNLLGRLIIGLMETLATRRNKLDEDTLKPVWFYMDEAADYIKGDHKFVQILTKARSSRVGATVAYQYLGQIESPPVEKALENAAIHSVCIQRGSVELTIEENKLPALTIRPYTFINDEPQMVGDEYDSMRKRLASDHPYKAPPRATDEDDLPLTEKNR